MATKRLIRNGAWYLTLTLCFILWVRHSSGYFTAYDELDTSKNCFCELKGSINDCSCNVDTVDHFNNIKIYPRLKSLLVKNFFRFYKVNLKNTCPFWPDDSKCAIRFCQVQNCDEEHIPKGLIEKSENTKSAAFKYTKEAQSSECSEAEDYNSVLSYLDTSLSDQAHREFERWAKHDEAEEDFCILEDENNGSQYVDLLINPERYTGYRGESAHRIWRSIYMENCFGRKNESKSLSDFIPQLDLNDVCLEQRAFYRIISGLHSSINIHLSAKYLLSESKDFLDPQGIWGPNVEEFKRRFSPETTNSEGPHWLRNLYFIYLVELRALAKAAPYLRREEYYTGIAEEDEEVKLAINDLLSVIESFSSHFNENVLFSNGVTSLKFKNEYKEKFRNISRIMDCVGCDKCRLWGKLQTQGLGTALKILYSEKLNVATESGLWERPHIEENPLFKLSRTEIVSLFNAFGRLSNSIFEMENFRKVLR
ncbi:ero1-like protein [Bactrocera tryoni]|uniref:ero1-like protein n=1 Tax=Bactrocera tryoni TaxID=59916 RepID=UPI001A9A25EF|nr:ero1-like protein [Bactrocera tryoni]XP_039965694.1 ero1-like protein [Bactrocera tryoni]